MRIVILLKPQQRYFESKSYSNPKIRTSFKFPDYINYFWSLILISCLINVNMGLNNSAATGLNGGSITYNCQI